MVLTSERREVQEQKHKRGYQQQAVNPATQAIAASAVIVETAIVAGEATAAILAGAPHPFYIPQMGMLERPQR